MVCFSVDIDGLDPSVAPGTGTPEIGGLTGAQGLEIIRGRRHLDRVGCDLVDPLGPLRQRGSDPGQSPVRDACVLPGLAYRD